MKLNKILWNRNRGSCERKRKSLKQKLTKLTWNKLCYCLRSNKGKIWAYYCIKAWIVWLCWACICLFFVMSGLCCFSRASLSFFFPWKSSDLNSRPCSSFSRRKPTASDLHLLLCFLSPVPLSSFPLRFLVSPNLSVAWAFFFSFSISSCLFWVSTYVLRSLSSNLPVGSLEVAHFQRALNPLGQNFWLFVLFLACTFSWGQ